MRPRRSARSRAWSGAGAFGAVALLGALGLAACGGGGKNATPTTTSSTVAQSTTTGTLATVTPVTTPTTVNANPSHFALIPKADRSPAGTWGKQPKVVVPPGKPPAHLEIADLIVGKGPVVQQGESVSSQYVLAVYSSHKVVQSSWPGGFPFTVGQDLIPGWSEGVVGMRVGGRREMIIPPSLGYGAQSPGAGIAANDTLVFVIDVTGITSTT
ncbi:MAG TPA: FKBP-type peptidyl-prolyl cis-trans isomerase [Acidimicrobiales bacterium]|nr:FKBP-type peptidyl-prolyl cis-trans isomerase [Acidimicrobiales bacterium]